MIYQKHLFLHFFILVIWVNEHEYFTELIYNSEAGLHIYQPRSPIEISLIQEESKIKYIGLCGIIGDKIRILSIKLGSVRPFIYNQIKTLF